MGMPKHIKHDILQLRKKGHSYGYIAKALNCCKSTVGFHCKRNGINDIGMTNHPVPEKIAKEIYEFCKTNTIAKAMEKFGYSSCTIKKYKKGQKS